MGLFVQLLLSTIAVYFSAWLLPGVHVEGFMSAFWVAIVLALLNTFLKPVLSLLSLPITILTLGLFLLIINAVIIMICHSLVSGFHIDNFWWGMLFGIILTMVTSLLSSLFYTNK